MSGAEIESEVSRGRSSFVAGAELVWVLAGDETSRRTIQRVGALGAAFTDDDCPDLRLRIGP